jgi:citrate lyase subunit beta/citryl-CoA lyase
MTTSVRPRRSVLYMPGSNARAIAKARELPCDAVIFDLEDSVAPDMKAEARAQVVDAVRAGGFGARVVVIRVNAAGTEWHEEDLAAALSARPDAVLIPKVSSAEAIFAAGRLMESAPEEIALWAMIETPAAILGIAAIAASARSPGGARLRAFVLGLNDLAKETSARFVPGRAPMLPWISATLIAARAEGLAAIDGVYNDLADEAGFAAECEQGRDLGFDGKTVIHPRQIEAANRLFAPSVEEVAKARAICALFDRPENRSRGAVALDGRMVERLHAEIAGRTVALAEAIAAAEGRGAS